MEISRINTEVNWNACGKTSIVEEKGNAFFYKKPWMGHS